MARKITDYDGGSLPVSGTNPYGALDDGATIVNAKANDDMQVFFQKLMENAGVTPNSLPDNTANGFQLFDAFLGVELGGAIPVSTVSGSGGVTGTITYQKNTTTNSLQISGALVAANAQNFGASPTINAYTMGTLPVGFRPTKLCFVQTYADDLSGNRFLDDLGVQYVDNVTITVSSGTIIARWIKPVNTVSTYGIAFNAVIPLG